MRSLNPHLFHNKKIFLKKLQIPSGKKRPNKKLIVTLSVVGSALIVLIVTLVLVFSISPAVDKPYVNRFAADYQISKDQRTAINRWGFPDGFLLAIDLNVSRKSRKLVLLWDWFRINIYKWHVHG